MTTIGKTTLLHFVVIMVFDIVYAATSGNWGTEVISTYVFREIFHDLDWGVGSSAAVITILLVGPVMIWNVYKAR